MNREQFTEHMESLKVGAFMLMSDNDHAAELTKRGDCFDLKVSGTDGLEYDGQVITGAYLWQLFSDGKTSSASMVVMNEYPSDFFKDTRGVAHCFRLGNKRRPQTISAIGFGDGGCLRSCLKESGVVDLAHEWCSANTTNVREMRKLFSSYLFPSSLFLTGAAPIREFGRLHGRVDYAEFRERTASESSRWDIEAVVDGRHLRLGSMGAAVALVTEMYSKKANAVRGNLTAGFNKGETGMYGIEWIVHSRPQKESCRVADMSKTKRSQ